MFRSVTSNVSDLSAFVANGHHTLHPVSSSLPKIPYIGFSPVRLQTGHPPPPSRPTTCPPLIGGCSSHDTVNPNAPHWVGAGAARHEHSGPEALGSPSGCVVPSGHRLLRPHPPLSASPDDFGFPPYTPGLCFPAKAQSFPILLCVSFLPCRLPYPGGRAAFDCSSPPALAFTTFALARHPQYSTQKSVHAWGAFRGSKVRFMLRPGRLLALHRQGRLRPSFHPMSHLRGTSDITTRANSQFPRPIFHRLDTQPYGLQANGATVAPTPVGCETVSK